MYTEKTIYKYFDIAKECAKSSDFPRVHIGCIIVYKGKVIAKGYNTTKEHPLQRKYNKYRYIDGELCNVDSMTNSLHAEIMALIQIRHFKGDKNKLSIFTYRELKDGTLANSMPCEACMACIKDNGIRNIYSTINNGWNYTKLEVI